MDGASILESVPSLNAWWVENSGDYEVFYALKDGLLIFSNLPDFARRGEALSAKPADAPFLHYLNLQKGNRGQAVLCCSSG